MSTSSSPSSASRKKLRPQTLALPTDTSRWLAFNPVSTMPTATESPVVPENSPVASSNRRNPSAPITATDDSSVACITSMGSMAATKSRAATVRSMPAPMFAAYVRMSPCQSPTTTPLASRFFRQMPSSSSVTKAIITGSSPSNSPLDAMALRRSEILRSGCGAPKSAIPARSETASKTSRACGVRTSRYSPEARRTSTSSRRSSGWSAAAFAPGSRRIHANDQSRPSAASVPSPSVDNDVADDRSLAFGARSDAGIFWKRPPLSWREELETVSSGGAFGATAAALVRGPCADKRFSLAAWFRARAAVSASVSASAALAGSAFALDVRPMPPPTTSTNSRAAMIVAK